MSDEQRVVEPNRVRVQTGGKVIDGRVVAIYAGGHVHSMPSESVLVRDSTGRTLGMFCRFCRNRVDEGPEATLLIDGTAVDAGLATYSSP